MRADAHIPQTTQRTCLFKAESLANGAHIPWECVRTYPHIPRCVFVFCLHRPRAHAQTGCAHTPVPVPFSPSLQHPLHAPHALPVQGQPWIPKTPVKERPTPKHPSNSFLLILVCPHTCAFAELTYVKCDRGASQRIRIDTPLQIWASGVHKV